MITITCQCGETYHAEERHDGKNIKCRKCGNVLPIRKLSAPPPAQRTAGPLQESRESTSVGPQTRSGAREKRWWQKHSYSLIGAAIIWGIIICFLLWPEHKPQVEIPSVIPPSPPLASSALNSKVTKLKPAPTEKPQKNILPFQLCLLSQ